MFNRPNVTNIQGVKARLDHSKSPSHRSITMNSLSLLRGLVSSLVFNKRTKKADMLYYWVFG
jgi:hypothetical protein